jgi:uncharacterized protein (TIGR02145 family)
MKKFTVCRCLSILAFLSFIIIFSYCKKDDPYPVFTDQGNIGTEGGIVKTNDGASVEIPADALTTNKTISITNITEGDTIVNSGCRIFELKPDGLYFADSVTITLPYDDTYTDLYSQEENYGVGIMVFQDNKWIKLKTKINTANKVAIAKTTHFSNYFVYFPGRWALYYYNNKKSARRILPVPYFDQGSTNWCAYYSLSMITKYAGYPKHGPYYASLLNETTKDEGFTIFDFPLLNRKLTEIGISAEIAFPAWANLGDLCGYILKKLNEGKPVWVSYKAIKAGHAIVVTGHDQTGFFINDPSGAFLEKINPDITLDEYAMCHITYEQFEDAMFGVLDLINPQLFGSENTIVISQVGKEQFNGPSINFIGFDNNIRILEDINNESHSKGWLTINGKFKPDGYTISVDLGDDPVSFNGSDYIWVKPELSNSREEGVTALLHVRIDKKDILGSPQTIFIPGTDCYNHGKPMISQLKNLQKGVHNIEVELISDDSQIIYDTWNFDLNIANEFIDNGQPPNMPSSPNPSNGATGVSTSPTLTWTCSDPDGDPLKYDVYFGTNENALNQITSGSASNSISRSSLNQGVTYFWRVVAKDNHSNSTESSVWSFTTVENLPIPVYQSSVIENAYPQRLVMTYNLSLAKIIPAASAFNVQVNSVVRSLNSVNISGTQVILILSSPVVYGDVVTVAYTKPSTNPLQTPAGGQAAPLGEQNVTNNVTQGSTGTVTDIDGNVYKTVRIGNQWWMAENLATTHYADGTPLFDGSVLEAIPTDKKYFFVYDNNLKNKETYGLLYNWYAVMNNSNSSNSNPSGVQGLCPTGWHVPSDEEWKELEIHLGITESEINIIGYRGTNQGGILKEEGYLHWESPNSGATNARGFTALPGGYRYQNSEGFSEMGKSAIFTSSTGDAARFNNYCWGRELSYEKSSIYRTTPSIGTPISLRCIKD